MSFGTLGYNEVLGANWATREMWTEEVKLLDDVDKKILYLLNFDIHNALYNGRHDVLGYIKYSLDRLGGILCIDFNDNKNIIVSQFWKRVLTKQKDGYNCSVNDFLYNMRKIHGQGELVEFIEDKIRTYFDDFKESKLRRYGFVIHNFKNKTRHVLNFGTDDDIKDVISQAEEFSNYHNNIKIAATVRHRMKYYPGKLNLLDTHSGDYKWRDKDVELFKKAVSELDKNSLIQLIDRNDIFFGVLDYADDEKDSAFIDIVHSNLMDDGSLEVITIQQHYGKYKKTVSIIKDDELNIVCQNEGDNNVIIPGADGEKIINLMLYSTDTNIN